MQKRYAFCSLCLIPFLTLLMASGFSWTGVNFSVIGSRGGRRWAFLVWGALTGNYFYLHTRELMELSGCRNRTLERLLFGALVCFVTAVGIPYLPRQLPGLSCLRFWQLSRYGFCGYFRKKAAAASGYSGAFWPFWEQGFAFCCSP